MKRIYFLCSMLLCCLTLPAMATITFNSPTVTSGSAIVFTAVGEGVGTNGYIDPSSLGSYYICVSQLSSVNPPACGGTGNGDFSTFFTVRGPYVVANNCAGQATTITFYVTRLNKANINFNIYFHFQMKFATTCGGTGGTAVDTAPTATVFPYNEYGNAAIAANYTKNNCGSGYTGSQTYESIPINTYVSTISQADANNQATTAAQNDANAKGNCTGPFAITNTSGNALSMTFTRTDITGQPNIGGVVAANSGTTYPFTIPNGVYTVVISPAGSPVNCTMTFNPVGQTYGPAPGHTFTGIQIGPGYDSSFKAQ